MRDIWFLITDHKGIVKILAILIAIFCVVSIGVSSYTSTMKIQEQQEQQAKKKEKEKQIKNSSVKLKKDQQKTIDEYGEQQRNFLPCCPLMSGQLTAAPEERYISQTRQSLSLIRKLIHLKLKSPLSSKAFQLKRSMSVR